MCVVFLHCFHTMYVKLCLFFDFLRFSLLFLPDRSPCELGRLRGPQPCTRASKHGWGETPPSHDYTYVLRMSKTRAVLWTFLRRRSDNYYCSIGFGARYVVVSTKKQPSGPRSLRKSKSKRPWAGRVRCGKGLRIRVDRTRVSFRIRENSPKSQRAGKSDVGVPVRLTDSVSERTNSHVFPNNIRV